MPQGPHTITRRTLLRGVGATVALPWLERFTEALPRSRRDDATAGSPVRLAVLYMPNGVYGPDWTPSGVGRDFAWSKTLAPLAELREHVTVITGLRNANSLDGDGHYAKTAPLLTGAHIRRTGGRDLENGVSMDQVAAAAIGGATPLSSLELGTEPVRPMEDMGYTTVYGGHVSWRTPTTPNAKEIVPQLVFDRLCRSSSLRAAGREQSVLDVVRDDARRAERELGRCDRGKLADYLDSLRELELRIARCAKRDADGSSSPAEPSLPRPPDGLPREHAAHVRLMLELLLLALRTDATRVATFMFGNAVSGIDMSFLDGVHGGHHELSHHENKPEKIAQYQRINQWHVEQYAWFLRQARSFAEGDGTLLDHSLVLFAGAMRDGNAHDPNDLPILLAGNGGGGVPTGQLLATPNPTPLCNLYVSLLRRVGVAVERFGDSTAALF